MKFFLAVFLICPTLKVFDVTPPKHIRHARVIGLYLVVVAGAVKDFKIRKYNLYGP